MGCLYQLIFPSGKSYIGITVQTAEKRFAEHVGHASKGQYAVTRAIRKYGAASVRIVTLAHSDDWADLCRMEAQTIADMNTMAPLGYNLTCGGDGAPGYVHDEAAKEKMRTWQIGRKLTPEHKEKVRQAMLGRVVSEETREKLRKRPRSAEARALMSAANKGRKRSPETCALISANRSGTKLSDEHRAAISRGLQGNSNRRSALRGQ